MKFQVLFLSLMLSASTTLADPAKLIPGNQVIHELTNGIPAVTVDGVFRDGSGCIISLTFPMDLSLLFVNIMDTQSHHILAQTLVSARSAALATRAESDGVTMFAYRLPADIKGAGALIRLTTYEDSSSFDFAISPTGLPQDLVECRHFE